MYTWYEQRKTHSDLAVAAEERALVEQRVVGREVRAVVADDVELVQVVQQPGVVLVARSEVEVEHVGREPRVARLLVREVRAVGQNQRAAQHHALRQHQLQVADLGAGLVVVVDEVAVQHALARHQVCLQLLRLGPLLLVLPQVQVVQVHGLGQRALLSDQSLAAARVGGRYRPVAQRC